jgi:uncharacterized repeat protein (TIGR02543 family)
MKKIALFYLLIFAVMGSFLSAHAYEANETQFIGQIRFEEDFSTLLDKQEKVVELSVGVDFTGVLTSNGRVFMWGKNASGQLGNATTVNSSIPIDITSRFNLDETDRIIQLVLGRDFAGALSDTGRVFMWGANGSSQLGRGNDTLSNIPIEITNSFNLIDDKIIQLEVGDFFAGSISQKRKVFTWGSNSYGQLGNDTNYSQSSPMNITSRFNFLANETINFFNLGSSSVSLITSDRIFMWGSNYYGQLGFGYTTSYGGQKFPMDLSGKFTNLLSQDESVEKVIIGNEHTIALTSEGKVYTWGFNDQGQIGNNISGPYAMMLNLLLIPFDETIVDVGVSDKSSFALTSSGLLYVWGRNTDNNISTTSTQNFLIPTLYDYDFNLETGKTVKYFDTSGRNSGLIASDDTIYMFGYNFSGQLGNGTTTNQSSPVLITSFEIKVNTDITFDSNGGTLVNKISQITGTEIEEPNEPAKDGYTFIGWFSDEALTEAYTFDTMPANDLTLYAKWTINPYTMTFDSNEGSAVTAITQDYATTVTAPESPTRTGYTFNGWFSDALLTNEFNLTTMPANDVTLYAKWTINEYTFTFDSNEGSSVAAITQDYATTVTAPTPPTRTGYTFNGWFSDALLSTAYTFDTMPASNTTLYAKWTINEYTVTFDSNEGSAVTAITQDYATTVIAPTPPTRTGYTFNGWFSDDALTAAYTFDTMPASNTTLYAKWTINEYTITFELNEGTLGVNQVTTYTVVSDPVVLLEATKDGHVFQGYYLEATFETLVSTVLPTEVSNLTVYALFYTTAFDTYLEAVNDLPNPLSIEDKETIESYLNTYDTFSTFEQGYVDRSLLVDALDTIITLEVERVKDAIDALSDPVSLSDEADLEIARALYEALTPEQQAEITNVTVLETREDALEVLKVETLITLIPQPINTQSEEEINEAKEAFDALTNDLQDDVSNEALLNELLTILKIVKDMETLLSEVEPTEEQLIPIQEQLQTLTEEQLGLIDETVYSDYLLLEEELTATSIWFFLGGGFSLLFLLLGYFYYRYQKEKQQEKQQA